MARSPSITSIDPKMPTCTSTPEFMQPTIAQRRHRPVTVAVPIGDRGVTAAVHDVAERFVNQGTVKQGSTP
jgi:hypothetical protein